MTARYSSEEIDSEAEASGYVSIRTPGEVLWFVLAF